MGKFEEYIEETRSDIKERMLKKFGDIEYLKRGKKFRCILCITTAHALGGDIDRAYDLGMFIDSIHTSSLLHDDVLDEHLQRRGSLPFYITSGVKKAILTGDKLLSRVATELSGYNKEEIREVYGAVRETLDGVFKEADPKELVMDLLSGRWEEQVYPKLIKMKTAPFFRTACRLGARCSNVDEGTVNKLGMCGEEIGMAFQIADDINDLKMILAKDKMDLKDIMPIAPMIFHYNHNLVKKLALIMLVGGFDNILSSLWSGISDGSMVNRARGDIDMHIKKALETLGGVEFKVKTYKNYLYKIPQYYANTKLGEIGD